MSSGHDASRAGPPGQPEVQFASRGFDVRGAVVVVTGGGSGIGRAICLGAAREGARAVVAVDFDEASAKRTGMDAMAASSSGCSGLGLFADCGKDEDMRRAIARVETEVGPIGLFVANAGIAGASTGAGILASDTDWQRAMGVNFYQSVYMARYLVPRMIQRGGGYIVVVASAAGLLLNPKSLTYTVSKAAAVSLADWLAVTHGDDGIGVTCCCPQGVATNLGLTSAAYSKGVAANAPVEPTDNTPEGRPGAKEGLQSADEIAAEVLAAVRRGQYLVLAHPMTQRSVMAQARDRDAWLQKSRVVSRKFAQASRDEGRILSSKL